MQTLLHLLQHHCRAAIRASYPGLSIEESRADVAPCQQESFGHYQCNSALRLGKLLKKNPREVAEAIRSSFSQGAQGLFEKVEIAGPGFLNLFLSQQFLSSEVQGLLADPLLGAVGPTKHQKIIVEFSSPNVAKELHVGHIRSTIIGDCLARLFEFLGYEVLRLNHIGDWGTQFGMLITYMKEHVPEVLEGRTKTDLQQLMAWYRASKHLFDADPEFKKRSQQEVVRLQSGDPPSLQAWKRICAISKIGFQEIYDLMGVKLIERGESFYNPILKEVVKELEQKGLVTVSNGAKCIFMEGFINREGEPLPLMIQKSDGGYNYDTTDMAALRHRIFDEKADRIICLTDVGQSLHFQLIFKAAELAGWLKERPVRLDHVGFGLVLGADGKKFKTRSGDTEKLIDLLLEAIERAKAILLERNPDISSEELERISRVIGIDAIKYADLSSHRVKDYTFSYDRMLRFEGNTAVFLLYAYVRINGIKRKTHANLDRIVKEESLALQHPSEMALGLHVRRFGEVLEQVEEDLLPNRLTDYLYELAEKFNAFFRDCRVEGSPEEKSRLILCEITSRILRQGLELLGLETLERM